MRPPAGLGLVEDLAGEVQTNRGEPRRRHLQNQSQPSQAIHTTTLTTLPKGEEAPQARGPLLPARPFPVYFLSPFIPFFFSP